MCELNNYNEFIIWPRSGQTRAVFLSKKYLGGVIKWMIILSWYFRPFVFRDIFSERYSLLSIFVFYLKSNQMFSHMQHFNILGQYWLTTCFSNLSVNMVDSSCGFSFKVHITSVGILNVCNLWILLRKIVIYLVGRKCRLHGLFSC